MVFDLSSIFFISLERYDLKEKSGTTLPPNYGLVPLRILILLKSRLLTNSNEGHIFAPENPKFDDALHVAQIIVNY